MDNKTSVYRAFSRMVCNFSFPENIKREYPLDIKKAIKQEIDTEEENLKRVRRVGRTIPKISDVYEEIPTYQIIMLSKEIGILEYIDDSITLRTINEKGYTNIYKFNGTNWIQLGQTRIQLPALFVEVVPNRTFEPFQLGGGQWVNSDIVFYALADRESDCSNILNISMC